MTNTFSDKIEPRRARNTKEAASEFEFIVEDLKYLEKRTSIVEYGCGFGAFAIDGIKWNLPQQVIANKYIEYIGIDINADYLFEAEKETNNCGFDEEILFNKPKFIQVHGTELEIGLNTADIVFLVLTLHDITQIEHLADAFYNIFRILKPGGKLIIYDKSTRTESDEIKYILWEKEDFNLLLKDLTAFQLKPFPNYSPEKKRFEILIKIIKKSDEILDHNQLLELFISLFYHLEKKYCDLINIIEEEQLETGGKNTSLEKIYKDIHSTVSGELIKLSKPKTSDINNITKELIKSPQPLLVSSLVSGAKLGKLYNVPSLPSHFLNRPDIIDPVKNALIYGTDQKLSISGIHLRYSLQGMGGIGKSVIASALAHDEEIRRLFPDGTIWIALGKKPDIITHQLQISFIFEDEPSLFDNVQQSKSYLSKILSDKDCLLILDDVWQVKDAAAFDVLGPDSQMLITTRNETIVTGMGAENFRLDILEPDQSLELLRKASNISKENSIPDEAIDIAKECGYLPLALAMIGSMLNSKPFDRWGIVLERLLNSDIDKIKFEFANYPYPDLFKALQVSVEELEPEIQKRYHEMSIFPEKYYVPESVFETYWKEDELLDFTHRELLDLFVERSLAHRGFEDGISLHDLQFDYVRKRADNIIQLHKKIVNAYSQNGSISWEMVSDDGYYHKFLLNHLINANMIVEAKKASRDLLLNCFDMHPSASVHYLKYLGPEAKSIAFVLMKGKGVHYSVKGRCIDLLGNAAKDYANILIKDKTTHPFVVSRGLALLGEDAFYDAKSLIKTCESSEVICQCIKILGKEAIDDARKLIKYNKSQEVLCRCLDLLGNEAVDDAKRLLKSSKSHEVLCRCLNLLHDRAIDEAIILIKDRFTHPFVICKCLDILNRDAIDDAKRLVKTSKSHEVLCRCLKILGEEGKDDAIVFLSIQTSHPYVLIASLDVLGTEAIAYAKKLLSRNKSHPYLVCKCLDILGEEAKKDAMVLLLEPKTHPHVLSKCIAILGEYAKTVAQEKLRNWKTENKTLLVRCFQIAADTVEGREAAHEMLMLWDKSIPSLLRVASLRSSADSFLRYEKAKEILNNWHRQFRPLVTAALLVYNNQPEQVEKYCRNIIQRFHAEITYTIRKKQRRYDGHILKALSNPYVRVEAETAVKSMIDVEEKNPGFLSDLLYEQAKCIIEGNWPLWEPVEEN